ncbi:MAG: CDP-glycerol glycerophosphotransferase family protein [Culicoidibacterales bacterium]
MIKSTLIKIVIRLYSSMFNMLPIKKNKIFMYSYYGSQYGCNPKYISEFMNEYEPKTFDIVWAFNDPKKYEYIQGIRCVRIMSWRYFYELATAKVIITNYRTTKDFSKRKGQYYIQTWHSSLRLKQIEQDAEESLPLNYIEMAKADSQKIDLLLSGCQFSSEIFKRAFWYSGEIFEYGTPRNDLLFHLPKELKQQMFKNFEIDSNKKIVLYAPTFRKENSLSVYDLDYQALCKKLQEVFGGEWQVLIKLHPHLINEAKKLSNNQYVLNVTEYDDIQQLLAMSDVLISDYSSLMFDFSVTKRPCFLYVPDLEVYTNTDRKLYFEIEKLPFIKAQTTKELLNRIEMFNQNDYEAEITKFEKTIGNFETGQASRLLVEHIKKIV